MPKWYPVWRAVNAGNATIGSILKSFGFFGLQSVARQVRFGRYGINGVQADVDPHLDHAADKRLAKQLDKMPPNTKIVQMVPPPNEDRWRSPDNGAGGTSSDHGRKKELLAAQKKARARGIGGNRASASSESKAVPPPPAPEAIDLASPPGRVPTTVHRIIRDTVLARRVKQLHRYKCQICGHSIQLPDGSFYAEAHHIQPLGEPDNGPDVIGNILCVCPNHHAELDLRARQITVSGLAVVPGHAVERRFVDYHNQKICTVAK